MEKMDGVPLWDGRRKVPWERKLELTETIAEMIKQLQDHKFDRIGGLYFKSALDCGTSKLEKNFEPKALLNNLAVDEHLDAGVDVADVKTRKIALPSVLQNLNLNDRGRGDAEDPTTALQSIDDEAQNKCKRLARTTIENESTADSQSITNESQGESKQTVLGNVKFAKNPDPLRLLSLLKEAK